MTSALTKIVVTGGAGFIGLNLINHLQNCGPFELTVIDDESLGSRQHINNSRVHFIKGDIRDDNALDEAFAGQDAIVHLAADTRVIDSIENPSHNFSVNVVGTFKVLRKALENNVKRFISASTGGAILGDAIAPVHEDMVANPLSPYGASKLMMEGYLSAFSNSYGLSTCALRFSNIYGPRSFHKGSVVAHFFKQLLHDKELVIYGDGTQARDFLYTGDLVNAIHKAIVGSQQGVFQLGSGKPTTLNELLSVISDVTEIKDLPVKYLPFRAGEIHTTWCDISKAQKELNFNPQTTLKDGLAETWDWFQAQ